MHGGAYAPRALSSGTAGAQAAAALFLASCALALGSPVCTRNAPVSEHALAQVAQAAASLAPGALVLVHPPWRTDVADALRSQVAPHPVGLALPVGAAEGLTPLMLVSVPHAPPPGATARWRPDRVQQVEDLTLSFFGGTGQPRAARQPQAQAQAQAASASPPPGNATWSARQALAQAKVDVVGKDGTVHPCNRWDAGQRRWACPGMNEWNWVGPTVLPVGGVAQTCLWMHPVTGAALVVQFPAVAAGTLTVGHGLADGAAANPQGQPLDVVVTAGAQRLAFRHDNAPGWRQHQLAVEAPGTALRVEITTPHDGARHFCMSLAVVP